MSHPNQNRHLSLEEFKGWPRWACVALAARCARRLQPLFIDGWHNVAVEHTKSVEAAILIGEMSASNAIIYAGAAANAHANAGKAAAYAANNGINMDNVVAAQAAVNATEAVLADAAYAAYAAADDYAFSGGTSTSISSSDDYIKIKTAIDNGEIQTDTPVPPTFFGPMWPNGVPDGWPDVDPVTGKIRQTNSSDSPIADLDTPQLAPDTPTKEIVFELDLPADATDEEVKQAVTELTKHLNQVHVAHGGNGLVLSDTQVFDPVMQEVPS